jgi:hypothetical protein
VPRVELLWWRECPSWERAVDLVREEMAGLALDPDALEVREVRAEDQAREEGFVGSPTIRVDGEDIDPLRDQPTGLTCRVYRRRDGRVSPLPDREDVRDAIAAALGEEKQ